MFKITRGKGFHVTFASGYTVSVQFGPGNYCDNYDAWFMIDGDVGTREQAAAKAGADGSSTAEIACWVHDGDMLPFPGGDTVEGRVTPERVLEVMQYAAAGRWPFTRDEDAA